MCDCIEMVNVALENRGIKLSQELIVRQGAIVMSNTAVACEFVKSSKKTPPPLFATYCPFCGEKYATTPPPAAADSAAAVTRRGE